MTNEVSTENRNSKILATSNEFAEPIIQKTTNYKFFNRLDGNRNVHEILIRQLMESFKEKPELRVARPILLNEKLEVIDGQHRIAASERLKIPVYYMIVPGLTIEDTRLLNALQRTWTLMDYAESFASTGEHAYRYFMGLIKEYGLTPASTLKYTFTKKMSKDIAGYNFRIGRYEPGNQAEIAVRFEKLREFKPYISTWKTQAFSLAVLRLLQDKNYDHDRMMRKIKEVNNITHHGAASDYLRELETIYNRGTSIGNFVRFI